MLPPDQGALDRIPSPQGSESWQVRHRWARACGPGDFRIMATPGWPVALGSLSHQHGGTPQLVAYRSDQDAQRHPAAVGHMMEQGSADMFEPHLLCGSRRTPALIRFTDQLSPMPGTGREIRLQQGDHAVLLKLREVQRPASGRLPAAQLSANFVGQALGEGNGFPSGPRRSISAC